MKQFNLLIFFSGTYLLSFCQGKPLSDSSFFKKELSSQELDNIYNFGKICGYIKYFYPDKIVAKTNWNDFETYCIPMVEKARNAEEFVSIVNKLFAPIAPEVKVFKDTMNGNYSLVTNNNANHSRKFRYYYHNGDGRDKEGLPFFNHFFMLGTGSKIVEAKQPVNNPNIPSPDTFYRVDLKDNIIAMIPLALYNTRGEKRAKMYPYPHIEKFNYKLRFERISAVISTWNIARHFYAYPEAIQGNFDSLLENCISLASSGARIYDVLERIPTAMCDNHAYIGLNSGIGVYRYRAYKKPFDCDIIKDTVFISKINDSTLSRTLHVGDIIMGINNKSLDKFLDSIVVFTPGSSPYQKRMRIVENLYNYFPYKKSFLLEFKNAKNEVKKEWIIDTTYKSPVEYSTKTISFDSGIAYVNISNVDYKLFSKNIDKINASKGLIIDLRNYPTYSTLKTLGHFTDSILEPGQWQTYKIRYPDQKRLEYKKVVPWKIKPAKPRIKVPVVVLIGRDNYSFGETCLEIIKHYHLGTLIGETSGGTNGDINFGYINSSFVLIWTGMKVTQRDGSRFMGVGVEPDIRVHTTRNEYIHGRDGVYDAAIEFLKKGRGIK